MGKVIQIEVPESIATLLEKDELLKKMIEEKIIIDVKEYLLEIMVLDTLAKDSELTEEDILEVDRKIKGSLWKKYRKKLEL